MWGLGLEKMLLVSIVKNNGESVIVCNRICPRLCLVLALKFTSDRKYFLVEMSILLMLVILGSCKKGAKLGYKWSNESSDTIFWDVNHTPPLVWLVTEYKCFCYVILGHYTNSEQWRLHLWGQSEASATSTISSWVFTSPCTLI